MALLAEGDKARLQDCLFAYELAHTVFSGQPDAQLLSVLVSAPVDEALASIEAQSSDPAAAKRLREYLRDLAGRCPDALSLGEKAEAQLSCYNRLIGGPGKKKAYPWESMYVSYRPLLFQESTLAVREAYRQFGYRIEAYRRVPDDHLSLECAFLAALVGRALECGESEEAYRFIEGRKAFLEEHLTRWLPAFAADMAEAEDGLYSRVAAFASAFAIEDLALLAPSKGDRKEGL